MADLLSRWYVSRTARASQIAALPLSRGTAPAALNFIPNGIKGGGLVIGATTAHATGLVLFAVTMDRDKLEAAQIADIFGALEAAPDDHVFDLRAPIDDPARTWARFSAFESLVDARDIDMGRFKNPDRTIRYHVRELARTMVFYSFLSRHHHAIGLDEPITTIRPAARTELRDHLLEQGVPANILPFSGDTMRQAYRRILADQWSEDAFGFQSGRYHLGHPSTNLKEEGGGR